MKALVILIVIIALITGCSIGPTAGGTTDTGNSIVIGGVVDTLGNPVSNTLVCMVPEDYDAINDVLGDSLKDTTDNQGIYEFSIASNGIYNIQAVHIYERTRLLINSIEVYDSTTFVSTDTLKHTGTLKIFLPDTVDTGYVYIPGTTIITSLSGNNRWAIIDSVPAGSIPSLYYKRDINSSQTLLRYNINVLSIDTITVTMPTWQYSQELYCNTTSSGAEVLGNILNFPVLVRLTNTNFDFTQAKIGGEDIRFTKPDNTLLPHEIEYWNAANEEAAIWVKIDTIYGNDNTHYFIMAWGNPDAINVSNSASVFDTANGFQGVWHLGEEGNTIAKDATGNHYNGTPNNMTAASAVQGMIGGALEFDGSSSHIIMQGTTTGKLNFPVKGTYTLAAWAYTDSLRGEPYSALRNSQEIISKGKYHYNLDIDNNDRWHMSEVEDVVGYHRVEANAEERKWTLVVAVRNGTAMDLYINGQLRNDSLFIDGAGSNRDTNGDLVFGKKSGQDNRYFDGKIDEVRISNVALTPDWIKLCYMNQKTNDKLILFK